MIEADYFAAATDHIRMKVTALRARLAALLKFHSVYQATFLGPDGKPHPAAQEVLADLAAFCRADASTFDDDPRRHALLEGRREVWLRIARGLRLDKEAVARLNQQLKESEDE